MEPFLDPAADLRPGRAVRLGPALRRVVAANPSPLTGPGTNTYVVGAGEVVVIDPGPDDPAHLHAILAALGPGERVGVILVTHAHLDHSPLARALAAQTGAPVLAYGDARAGRSPAMAAIAGEVGGGEGVDAAFAPDRRLADGERLRVGGTEIEALWTPGHFGNHMCFAVGDAIFCGDLVLGWASTLVSPPDGDVAAFLASCRRLRARRPATLHPGHGEPIIDPAARIDWLIAHRQAREAEIRAVLAEGPATPAEIVARLYAETPRALWPAAERNVLAHLIDLASRGLAAPEGPLAPGATFRAPPLAPPAGPAL